MKSWLLYPAAAASGVLAVVALLAAAMTEDARLAWLGAALAGLPLPLFILRTRLMPIVRTSENLPLLLLLAAAGLMIAGWEAYMERQAEWPPVAVALAGFLLFATYVFAYSRFGRFASPKLAVGNKLPEFDLAGLDDGEFRSTELRGSPAVVLFFASNDCPFCMGQVREIAARSPELEQLGIRLVLVSPQPAARMRKLAAQTGLSSAFKVDRGNRAAEVLGIANEGSVMPTVVVINENGTILYSDQTDNYRVRPEPDIYISILKRAGAISATA